MIEVCVKLIVQYAEWFGVDGEVWFSEATLQSSAVKVLVDFVTSTHDINQVVTP